MRADHIARVNKHLLTQATHPLSRLLSFAFKFQNRQVRFVAQFFSLRPKDLPICLLPYAAKISKALIEAVCYNPDSYKIKFFEP